MDLSVVRSVQLNVFCQVAILSKTSATNRTFKWFIACMDAHMVEEVPRLLENLCAAFVPTPKHPSFSIGVFALLKINLEGAVWDIDLIVELQQVL